MRMAATGWRVAPGKTRDRMSKAALAAIVIFSLGAAMLLHPRMFQ